MAIAFYIRGQAKEFAAWTKHQVDALNVKVEAKTTELALCSSEDQQCIIIKEIESLKIEIKDVLNTDAAEWMEANRNKQELTKLN